MLGASYLDSGFDGNGGILACQVVGDLPVYVYALVLMIFNGIYNREKLFRCGVILMPNLTMDTEFRI